MRCWKQKLLFFSVFLFCGLSVAYNAFAENNAEYIRYLVDGTSERELAENKVLRVVQGHDPVYFNFTVDEKVCKEKYGDEALQICGRSFRDVLPETSQIQITPKVEGRWQWNTDFSLVFYPKNEWTPNTKFTVKFGKESLPKLTVITKPLQFTTQPLLPTITGDFKFDPENPEKMVLSGAVSFNYRIVRESLESKVQAVPVNAGVLSLGTMETSFHNNRLHYAIPVLKVHNKAENVKLQLYAGVQAVSGGKLASNYEYVMKVPSRSEIFKLAGYASGVENLPNMSAKQTVVMEFSLPVKPADLENKIQAVLLPREKVQTENARKEPPYTWWSQAEITPDVLKKSEKLDLQILNGSDEPSRFLILAPKQAVEAGRCAYLTIKAPVRGPENFVIDSDIVALTQFRSLESAVKIMQKGSVLSLHGDKKLSLYARNADEISYEVRQIRPEFINTYVSFLKQARYGQVYGATLDSISIVNEGKIPLAYNNAEEAQFASLDLAPYLNGNNKGIFHITVSAKKDGTVFASDSRFVMLSDLGIILKADNEEENIRAYLVSLASGEPVSGAEVEVLGANGIALFSGKTDKNGEIGLPSLRGYEREKQVTAITAKFKDDLAVMPYYDYQTVLRPKNNVNTYGKEFSETSLNGFVFTERDLYRAGETARFGFILKQGKFENKMPNLPLTATVYSANGQLLAKEKIGLTENGFGEFSFKIPEKAVNGVYQFNIEKADGTALLVSKNFHVMDFVPDTIKASIENNMASGKKWYKKGDLRDLAFTVQVQNLFGAPAINNTVKASLRINPFNFVFENEYKDFKFYDAGRLDKSAVQDLGTFSTDENGRAVIKIDGNLFSRESAALVLQADVQDAQGGSAITVKDYVYTSPLNAVVGYKTQSNLSFLAQDEKAEISLIALDAYSKPYKMGQLSAELYQSELVKSLVKVQDKYQYTKVRKEKLLSKGSLMLDAGVTAYALDTSAVGEKLLVLKDAQNRTVLQVRYVVVGDSTVQFDEYRQADLQAFTDNKDYKAGETVKVAIKTPYEGTGLITVEREKVYAQKWFKADKGSRMESVEIPEGLEGKAYVNVLYFRNIEDGEIFVEPCASVILPITVDISKRKLDVRLKIGDGSEDFVARPGKEFTVNVRSAEPAKALVYAVDEGIIQLTGYAGPNPLNELFLDRALSVQTYQYLDMLMPEFGLIQKELAKFGGDMMSAKMANAMRDAALNPFKVKNRKPAVFWSGLIDVDSTGTDVRIPVPDTFNGNMRVFAVALSDTKVNAVQKDVLCQAEVVIQPFVPSFVSPGDEFEASILLTDMRKDKTQKDVMLNLDFGSAFEIMGEKNIPVHLEEKKQNLVSVRVKVRDTNDVLGEQNITVSVAEPQTGLNAVMPSALSVRPASALYTTVELGMIGDSKENKVKKIAVKRNLYPQFADINASVSSSPAAYVQALLQRNRTFVCPGTVQMVAKAMPLLYLLEHREYAPNLDGFTEKAIREQITDTLKALEGRFNYNGLFYRWDNYGTLTLFEQAFVLDFLTTAKEQGLFVAPYVYENALNKMQENLSVMVDSPDNARAVAYGAWGLTRNGIITSQIMANLTTYLEQKQPKWEQDIAASLMAASMKLMMQDEIADRLIRKYEPASYKDAKNYSVFDRLAERALYLEVVAKHFPEFADAEKTKTVTKEMYSLLSEYFSQSSEALAVRTVMEYGIRQKAEDLQARISYLDKADNVLTDGVVFEKSSKLYEARAENNPAVTAVNAVELEADRTAYYQLSVTGYDRDRFAAADAKPAFVITREFRDTDGYPLEKFRLGEEAVVVIKAKSLTGKAENVLITDILPAGFEFAAVKTGSVESLRTYQGRSNADVLQEEREMKVEYADRQEDRAVLFAVLDGEESVFRYKVRAGNKGNFVLPDITAQSVENALLYGRDMTIKDSRIVIE